MKIPFRQYGDRITLQLLDESDVAWIAALIDEAQAAIGQPWRELLVRLEGLPTRTKDARAVAVIEALRHRLGGREPGGVKAAEIRSRVFGRAALDAETRRARIEAVAGTLGISADETERGMWADLPGERCVTMPRGRPTELVIASEANLLILQRLLLRCFELELRLWGNARSIVRVASVRGLLATAEMRGNAVQIEISGPLALFHRTTVYGRALGSILAHLPWCERFELDVHCDLGRGPATVQLRAPLLLPPSSAPKRYDSRVEERFAQDIAKRAPRWRVVREPAPVIAGKHLAFPDFVLEHRDDPGRRWWVEIVGFWTSDYLATKLARYRAADLNNVILCIDAQRAIDEREFPHGVHVTRYKRRVDVDEVLSIIEPSAASYLPKTTKASHCCETLRFPGGAVGDRTPDL